MFLAFGESLAIVGKAGLFLLSAGMLLAMVWKATAKRRLTVRDGIVGAVAAVTLLCVAVAFSEGNAEYNPPDVTLDRIVGTYANGNRVLVMNRDGTYLATNLQGYNAGKWTHYDWNLAFDGAEPREPSDSRPRWIVRKGRPSILPYYTGPDGSNGIELKKVE